MTGRGKYPQDFSDSEFFSGGEVSLSNDFQEIKQISSSVNGYSVVYQALRMGKWHILKCLKPEYSDKKEYRTLLQKEFELSYHLNHPNIVRTLGMEEVVPLGTCIVMEYVDGRTLRHATEQGLTKKQSQKIVLQLCQALSYIHQRQIFHRDLKLENVMLTYNGNDVKLIDFGLSDADEYAILKQRAGTLRYTAPELLTDTGKYSPCTDIYALGILMQELPNLSLNMKRVARRCCKHLPEDRYQTADAVTTAIVQQRRFLLLPILFVILFATVLLSIWLLFSRKPQDTSTMGRDAATSSDVSHEKINGLPLASAVSPDVAFFLSQTDIPKDIQHEPRFVHLAEYAYSITMHFMKTQSINANAEREAFGYVKKEIDKTMGNDKDLADKYLRYLDVLTQIIAEDYRQEYLSQSASGGNTPNKEILHRIDKYAEEMVPFLYRITNLADTGPSTTNEKEVLTDMERQVEHFVGKDSPFYSTYIKHAHAAAQKIMSERRELWKASGQWSE